MATPAPKKAAAPTKKAPASVPKDDKSPVFSVVDTSLGATHRRVRVPKEFYRLIELLKIKLDPEYGRLSLEEILVMTIQAGTVAMLKDPRADRALPAGAV